MFTLSTFYHSQEWEKLLKQLRIDRLNDEGEIICEYCGKPISKAYDMIGHHKTELTDENVNDLTISLNPDNIAFVHHRCHNYIHNKFGYAVREIYLVYGAPMSDKTAWVHDNMAEGDLIIDIDSIWQCVSGCERYVKPNRLRSIVFRVRDSLLEACRYRAGKWQNCYIIGGYPLSSERERLCKELGARSIFIDSSLDDCLVRLRESGIKNQDEFAGYISDWFARYTPDSAPPSG